MKLLRGFQPISELHEGSVATIGNFDGVHRGHQALLKALRQEADRLGLPLLVVVFEPQPGEFFHAQQAPVRLSSFREKAQVLRGLGVDYICCLTFNDHLASMDAMEFSRHVFSLFKAKYILIGEDFCFGRGRRGDINLLSELGRQVACVVQPFPDFFIDHQRVSSTKIRQALHLGELNDAATLLGRPYSMCGRVVHGDGLARQWGFPTANLSLHRKTLPLKGVFCVRVMREGKHEAIGVANSGCRPTLDGNKHVLEVHLFDVNESLYGDLLQVSFVHKIRDEIKFSSVDALVAQIHNDVAVAKDWFSSANEFLESRYL